ncbi:nuclear transport factor 2 family protein [Roseococcus sp. SDR]|uniref:nuclear transport factor 2 family protein n=1 Tax=Roseococcus sp. SDR TaxID=2835532 RepID=UPI001BCA90FD|nr:nuclear transport factor 2 family protein [Roseococcus sp. SDR]MBS7792640.1 nuclear transport factor 2 family protein [Roseococcus sp. SDR]MBV1847954.1 nuclear transport factor 2 family protein [Roseococcus sp. SDR]
MHRRALLALALALPASIAMAHPHHDLTAERAGHIEQQVMAFRVGLQAAARERDVVQLRAMFAPSFTHTHTTGKVDGRDARLVSILAGEPVIELANVEELSIRVLNPDAVVVTGRSPIRSMAENRVVQVRWVQMMARVDGEWVLAASQATRLPEGV